MLLSPYDLSSFIGILISLTNRYCCVESNAGAISERCEGIAIFSPQVSFGVFSFASEAMFVPVEHDMPRLPFHSSTIRQRLSPYRA
ncbi:hypothetical protein [Noviherbaspirillum pedocola]|uniref:hypothetical protein n=1 Tax=Noviherbaspirillum pedocola TaxID=2801341 RepID=UPI00190B637E|nr:hypothetical protein [Noviherbaspirillum pedocola]